MKKAKKASAAPTIDELVARIKGDGRHIANEPAAPAAIEGNEKRLGLKLPSDYVEFLSKCDGARLFLKGKDSLECRFEIYPLAFTQRAGTSSVLFSEHGGDKMALELEAEQPWVFEQEKGGGKSGLLCTSFTDFLTNALDAEGEYFWRGKKFKAPPAPRPPKKAKKAEPQAAPEAASTEGLPQHAIFRLAKPKHSKVIHQLVFTEDGGLVTASEDAVRVWGPSGESRAGWTSTGNGVGAVAVSKNGLVAWVEHKKTIRLHSIATGERVESIENKELGALAFSPDGKTIAFASGDKLVLRDIEKKRDRGAKGGLFAEGTIVFSDDGRYVKFGYSVFTVKDAKFQENPPQAAEFPVDEERVRIPDEVRPPIALASAKLVAGAIDKADVGLFAMPARKQVASLKGHEHSVEKLAFSRDGKRLASSGGDKTVLVWDVPGLLANAPGHS